jgi:hypothetical protein
MAVGAARPLGRSLARRWGTFTPGGTVGVRGRRLRPGRRDTLADLTFGFARGLLWAWGSGAVSTVSGMGSDLQRASLVGLLLVSSNKL